MFIKSLRNIEPGINCDQYENNLSSGEGCKHSNFCQWQDQGYTSLSQNGNCSGVLMAAIMMFEKEEREKAEKEKQDAERS